MERKIEKKPASKADEVRDFLKGRLELVKIGGVSFGRATLEPDGNGPRASSKLPVLKAAWLRIPNTMCPELCM